jgi:hypothetical protein
MVPATTEGSAWLHGEGQRNHTMAQMMGFVLVCRGYDGRLVRQSGFRDAVNCWCECEGLVSDVMLWCCDS